MITTIDKIRLNTSTVTYYAHINVDGNKLIWIEIDPITAKDIIDNGRDRNSAAPCLGADIANNYDSHNLYWDLR